MDYRIILEERIRLILEEIDLLTGGGFRDMDRDKLDKQIHDLCLEVDRNTRHACAEAVLNLAQEPGEKIDVTKAHAACINVKTI